MISAQPSGARRWESWLVRASGVALCAFVIGCLVVGAVGYEQASHWIGGPGCPWRALTGIVCPFCGMTHATLALGAGYFSEALHFHPVAPLVLAATLWMGLRIARARLLVIRPHAAIALLGAIALLWVVNVAWQAWQVRAL